MNFLERLDKGEDAAVLITELQDKILQFQDNLKQLDTVKTDTYPIMETYALFEVDILVQELTENV